MALIFLSSFIFSIIAMQKKSASLSSDWEQNHFVWDAQPGFHTYQKKKKGKNFPERFAWLNM